MFTAEVEYTSSIGARHLMLRVDSRVAFKLNYRSYFLFEVEQGKQAEWLKESIVSEYQIKIPEKRPIWGFHLLPLQLQESCRKRRDYVIGSPENA